MTLEMAMELEVSYNENYCMESRDSTASAYRFSSVETASDCVGVA